MAAIETNYQARTLQRVLVGDRSQHNIISICMGSARTQRAYLES
jgi:hypothetical protein